MVGKAYAVSNNSKTVENKEEACDECDSKMQADDHVKRNSIKKKNFSFIMSVNEVKREMVKMKPSKKSFFHDDNSSSTATSFWNNINIPKWNRENLQKSMNFVNRRVLIKILAAFFMIVLIALIVSSSSSSSTNRSNNDNENVEKRQRLLININKAINNNSNDSIIDTSTSSKISITEVTASPQTNKKNVSSINDESSVLPPLTTNIIGVQNKHTKKSNDEVTLTKNYVERINFYTTSNKNLFSAKVSPTLPSINKNFESTSEIPVQNYANDCESTSLPLCQGILTYDLTDAKQKWNLTNLEYQHFEHLVDSNCSNRVHEYVCHMLEPECRPSKAKNLMPCRRICKGIFESCSHIIASSEILTEFFDCNSYIDSNDLNVCEDITRARKNCFSDEFQCGDLSCIPLKWRCDNIRDCANGEDEDECKFCNYDEFKCLSDQTCISEKWLCDGYEDCTDASDETNCDNIESEEDTRIFYDDMRDYTDQASVIDHNDSDGDKIVSTGDDVMPIFINPNSTDTNESQMSSSAQMSNRFRSTMRKIPDSTPKSVEETSTKITKRVTFHSTSHLSPCPEDHLRCVDGLCITLDQICDKIRDCSDNSDELHCEY